MLTESEIKAYTVDIPNDIQAAQRASGSLERAGSGTPDELEQACMTLLVGEYWCDVSHLKARIYSILSERGRMDINPHGQMVIVSPNTKLSD